MTLTETLGALRALVVRLFPELGAGTHFSVKAKITAVHGDAGTPSANGQAFYSVDVKPLKPDGSPDATRPALSDVPLDVPGAGSNRGVFMLPGVGSIVRLGFYGGDPSHPYIAAVLGEGRALPSIDPSAIVIQAAQNAVLKCAADGTWTLQAGTTGKVTVKPDGSFTVDGPTGAQVNVKLDGSITLTSVTKVTVSAPMVNLGIGGDASLPLMLSTMTPAVSVKGL